VSQRRQRLWAGTGGIDALIKESSVGTVGEAECQDFAARGCAIYLRADAEQAATPVAGSVSKYERRMAGVNPGAKGRAIRPPTGEKEAIHERQAIDGSARMPLANELLHLLRRGSHAWSPLWPSLGPSLGPRGRVGMCLAGMPTPIGSRERDLHISRRNRHGEDGAPIPRLLVVAYDLSTGRPVSESLTCSDDA
jgi:hypothetical protein